MKYFTATYTLLSVCLHRFYHPTIIQLLTQYIIPFIVFQNIVFTTPQDLQHQILPTSFLRSLSAFQTRIIHEELTFHIQIFLNLFIINFYSLLSCEILLITSNSFLTSPVVLLPQYTLIYRCSLLIFYFYFIPFLLGFFF